MMIAPFADLELRMVRARNARLANAVVTPASGEPFQAEFSEADRTTFEAPQVGDYTLRYLAESAHISRSDLLDIDGKSYRVAETPQRLNRYEMHVGLMQERS